MAQIRRRSFTEADRADAPLVVVLSETAARRLFPGRDAVGERLVIRDRFTTVIGIVRDLRANPLTSDSPTSVVYVPIAQWPFRTVSVVLRVTSGDPTALTPALQQVVGRLDAQLGHG